MGWGKWGLLKFRNGQNWNYRKLALEKTSVTENFELGKTEIIGQSYLKYQHNYQSKISYIIKNLLKAIVSKF